MKTLNIPVRFYAGDVATPGTQFSLNGQAIAHAFACPMCVVLREMTSEELLASRRKTPLSAYERHAWGILSFQAIQQREMAALELKPL